MSYWFKNIANGPSISRVIYDPRNLSGEKSISHRISKDYYQDRVKFKEEPTENMVFLGLERAGLVKEDDNRIYKMTQRDIDYKKMSRLKFWNKYGLEESEPQVISGSLVELADDEKQELRRQRQKTINQLKKERDYLLEIIKVYKQ